jgi:hypothetical protein
VNRHDNNRNLFAGNINERRVNDGNCGNQDNQVGNCINRQLLERILILKFYGINEEAKLRAWIVKLSCFFFRLNLMDDYQKIQFASLHLEDMHMIGVK